MSAETTEVKPHVPKNTANKQTSLVSKTGPNGMIIRGMTFYKSEPDPMVADDGEPGENCKNKHCHKKVQQKVLLVKVSCICEQLLAVMVTLTVSLQIHL